jgi:phage-related baseplate assembly protein
VSGITKFQQTTVGDFRRFLKIYINNSNVAEIISIFDNEGNEYYEVDYLSQNIIYKSIPNLSEDAALAPNILVPYSVPRRFVVENSDIKTTIIFGAASSVSIENDDFLADPSNLMLDIYGKQYVKDAYFDPKKLINSDKFGIAPANTTLNIVYRINTSENVNAAAGSIDTVTSLKADFKETNTLNKIVMNEVINSFVVENDDPIVGTVSIPDSEELKIRILDNFATQGRAVTEKDYESILYNMPSRFGAIKRVRAVKDIDSFKKNINLYLVSEDVNGALTVPTINIKKNVKTWLDNSKSVADTVDLMDAKILNLKINFSIVGSPDKSKSETLNSALVALRNYYSRKPEIGEPFLVNNILSVLKKVDGVLDVKDITITSATGNNYARTPLQVNTSTSMITYNPIINIPLNVIWEVKYPSIDISGVIV